MTHLSISAVALAAMSGVLVMAWQAPAPQPTGIRMAQVSPSQPDAAANPVTPTPGAPSKTAIPEKIGEPVQSRPTTTPADNLGRQAAPAGDLDLKQPSPGMSPPADTAVPPQR